MFLLNDTASHIDPKVFARGQEYFDSGAVISFEERLPGHWLVKVSGTATYQVNVQLDGEAVRASSCNCPYNLGMHCKHEVAGLLAIADDLAREAFGKASGQNQKLRRGTPFHVLVSQVSAEVPQAEILDFIVQQGEQTPGFRDAFLLHFAKELPGSPRENYLRIVRANVQRAEGTKHYLAQAEAEEVADDLRFLFENERSRLAGKDDAQVRELANILLNALTQAQQAAEDYEGYLALLCDEIKDFLSENLPH